MAAQKIENKRTRELSEEELTTLRDEVEKYSVEGDLRRFTNLNIKRLKEIGCYRGRRHVAVRAAAVTVQGSAFFSLCTPFAELCSAFRSLAGPANARPKDQDECSHSQGEEGERQAAQSC